ncbi:hypothetical protein EYC84_005844 [Monilinia fructicola]|uniref:Uncharacterized protein n=1 Tax=Monilinia fructicola TaxID=38448 RepID=A0A5M9K0S3_MONFR|nr:hypothetical protein EYC84_005844 [Monilinia fructicola]
MLPMRILLVVLGRYLDWLDVIEAERNIQTHLGIHLSLHSVVFWYMAICSSLGRKYIDLTILWRLYKLAIAEEIHPSIILPTSLQILQAF